VPQCSRDSFNDRLTHRGLASGLVNLGSLNNPMASIKLTYRMNLQNSEFTTSKKSNTV